MKIHILGICGTFMGSLAVLAKALGHEVSGCDANVYPPMSTQLEEQGIQLAEGYDPQHLQPHPDLVIVGNAMSRGNPCVEYVLDQNLPYISGPQWLCENVLQDRWVLAVAGTHGKTTTSTMLTWILEQAGLQPGYLIGGVPLDFPVSARLGEKPFFVIEADEYDSAFFDKRSKFVHYRPRTAILNNLEFDHADIFDSIGDIQKQFHHLVRIIPSHGRVIVPKEDANLQEVLAKGCWSEQHSLSMQQADSDWYAKPINDDGSHFAVYFQQQLQGEVQWSLTGQHSVNNGLAAIAAAHHVGIRPQQAIDALKCFNGVKRRMEVIYDSPQLKVYDDFAHHPTAIQSTLEGLRRNVDKDRIIALIEPRSNTMRMGTHRDSLQNSTQEADQVIWYQPPNADWNLEAVFAGAHNTQVENNIDTIVESLCTQMDATLGSNGQCTHIVVMSNGGFGGIHNKLVKRLQQSQT